MTLTDIFELQKEIAPCKNPSDIQTLFDDNGEDCDTQTARLILDTPRKFTIQQDNALINDKLIFCPDCKNSSPDKILSNAVEVISISDIIHFGCCECGTMFHFTPETNQFSADNC